MSDEKGYSPDLWQEIADLGWLGIMLPERYGGMEGGFLDLAVLFEEVGRACFPGPFPSTVILGAIPVLKAGSQGQKAKLLPQIASGKLIMTMALVELNGSYEEESIQLAAKPNSDGWVLSGTKMFVPDANVANVIVCVARTGSGVTLFLADANSDGLGIETLKTVGGDKQCEVTFNGVEVSGDAMLGENELGWTVVQETLNLATVAQCAQMLGIAQQTLEMTINYARDRHQFGRPIGSFQAIQHQCADMAIEVDGMRLLTYQAAWRLSEGLDCAKEIAMAKAWASEGLNKVALYGIKIHGGVGYMRDHDMTIHFRHATAMEFLYGNARLHYEALADELSL